MFRWLCGLAAAGALAGVAVPAAAQELIGLSRAIGVAERSLSARAIEGELETSGGRLVYEIDLVRGHVLHRARVDARTGKLVSAVKPRAENWLRSWFDKDRLQSGGKAAPLSDHLVALERHSRGEVKEVEFEIRKGRGIYEIELATAAGVGRVLIDAATGQRIERAYDD
nr:PepSY domain-containing protein [Sphingomonas sp. Y57]